MKNLKLKIFQVFSILIISLLCTGIFGQTVPSEYQISCTTPQIGPISVVRFSTTASVVFRYNTDYTTTIDLRDATGLTTLTSYPVSPNTVTTPLGNQFELAGLAKNANYSLWANNNCGNATQLATFSTSLPVESDISVSQEIFAETANFVNYHKNETVYDFISGNSNLSWLEKLYFMQRYIYNDSEFSVLGNGNYPPPPPPSGKDCYCKVIKASPFSSHGIQIPTLNRDNGRIDSMHTAKIYNLTPESFHGEYEYAEGASKKQHLDFKDRCTKKDYSWVAGGGGTDPDGNPRSQSPYFSRLSYNWLCTNSTGYPSEGEICPCKKKIYVAGRYDSKLNVNTDTWFSFPCFGNTVCAASAEDNAVMFFSDSKGKTKIMDAGRISLRGECDYTINREFFTEVVDVAAVGAKMYLSLTDTTIVKRKDFPMLIDSFAKQLKDVIRTPFASRVACGQYSKSGNLIDKKDTLDLTTNNVSYIYIYSYSSHFGHGATTYKGYTEVNSNVNLGAAVYRGTPNGQSMDCCTDGIAQWIGSSVGEAPWTTQMVLNDLNDWFGLLGFSFNNTEFGQSTWKVVNCDPTKPDPEERATDIITSKFGYRLFDARGILMVSGQDEGGEMLLKTFQQHSENLTPGIYFMEVNIGTEKKTYKFVKTNQ